MKIIATVNQKLQDALKTPQIKNLRKHKKTK
jgi:hypothetical protein